MLNLVNRDARHRSQSDETADQACQGASSDRMRLLLREAGLRPTEQRMLLAWLVFRSGGRHFTVEELAEEAGVAGANISLATVYNTLNHFRDAGLIRSISVKGAKSYYDTTLTDHHHFYSQEDQTLIDIPENQLVLNTLPEPPSGMEIAHVDVIIHVRPRKKV